MKKFPPLLLAALLAGCAAPSPVEKAADALDRDGVFFSVCSEKPLLQKIDAAFDVSLSNGLRGGRHGELRSAQRLLEYQLIWNALGLRRVTASGESSVVLRDGTSGVPPLYRNRRVWIVEPGVPGALDALIGDNAPFDNFTPPAPGTVFSGALRIDPAAAYRALEHAGVALFSPLSPTDQRAELPALLEKCRGVFSFRVSLVAQPGKNIPETAFSLRLNTRDRALFDALVPFMEETCNGLRDGDSVVFPGRDSKDPPVLLFQPMQGVVFASRRSFAAMTPQSGSKQELWSAAAEDASGAGYFYIAPGAAQLLAGLLAAQKPAAHWIFPFTAELLDCGSLSILRRTRDGFAVLEYANCGLHTAETLRGALPLLLVLEKALGDEVRTRIRSELAAERDEACRAALGRLSAMLKAYADAHSGAFPKASGAAGLRELFAATPDAALDKFTCPARTAPKKACALTEADAPYFYFGGFRTSSPGNFPLLIDRAHAHNGSFNVLFTDGTIRRFRLENPGGAKHAVSRLHTVFRYTPEQFKLLLARADSLDKGGDAGTQDGDDGESIPQEAEDDEE